MKSVDVVCVGRASVDLYGNEIGTGIEDVSLFRKAVGGCPANIAIGCARLGLQSALISRVGNEQLGRFICRQLARDGVDTRGISTDPHRQTALVFLAVADSATAPHVFYRRDCADMAISAEMIDPALIAAARAVVVTGTHFSTPQVAAASWHVIELARAAGAQVVFDIDFRPALWGLADQAAGDARLALSDRVSQVLAPVLAAADIVVGTEEEFSSALGHKSARSAVAEARQITDATLVLKRGATGCEIFPADMPAGQPPVTGRGFPVDVVNTVGAGDAFMSGFLKGWLDGLGWSDVASMANACGAIAVSRLMCSQEYPTLAELEHFMVQARRQPRAQVSRDIAHIHHAALLPRQQPGDRFILACDHRTQFRDIATRLGLDDSRFGAFKQLAVQAAGSLSALAPVGVILDGEYGRDALFQAGRTGLWTAQAIEQAGSVPLRFVTGQDVGAGLQHWPAGRVVKCLCHYAPGDPPALRDEQQQRLLQLHQACHAYGREFLLEIIPPGDIADRPDALVRAMRDIYALGVRPDWWKLEPLADPAAWQRIGDVIRDCDPYCRGIVILGQNTDEAGLADAFRAAASEPLMRGFAISRAIVAAPFERWLTGQLDDAKCVQQMSLRLGRLIDLWRNLRSRTSEVA